MQFTLSGVVEFSLHHSHTGYLALLYFCKFLRADPKNTETTKIGGKTHHFNNLVNWKFTNI